MTKGNRENRKFFRGRRERSIIVSKESAQKLLFDYEIVNVSLLKLFLLVLSTFEAMGGELIGVVWSSNIEKALGVGELYFGENSVPAAQRKTKLRAFILERISV